MLKTLAFLKALIVFVTLGAIIPSVAVSQDVANRIAILNQELMYSASDFGARAQSVLDMRARDLALENRSKEAELQAEELALTEQRPSLSPEDFRALADVFDDKVSEIRTTQANKEAELVAWASSERQRFFQDAIPILQALVTELGAFVVLDSRTVVFATENVDITQLVIDRLNAAIGDGAVTDQ